MNMYELRIVVEVPHQKRASVYVAPMIDITLMGWTKPIKMDEAATERGLEGPDGYVDWDNMTDEVEYELAKEVAAEDLAVFRVLELGEAREFLDKYDGHQDVTVKSQLADVLSEIERQRKRGNTSSWPLSKNL